MENTNQQTEQFFSSDSKKCFYVLIILVSLQHLSFFLQFIFHLPLVRGKEEERKKKKKRRRREHLCFMECNSIEWCLLNHSIGREWCLNPVSKSSSIVFLLSSLYFFSFLFLLFLSFPSSFLFLSASSLIHNAINGTNNVPESIELILKVNS